MDVTAATSPTSGAPAPSPQANAVLSSDFETFLQMLTAQAKYQDPLEPIDSSEYAAQLAQFSMVEQQVKSNDLLTALTAQLGANNMAQMSSWIGMEARTTAAVHFDGAPLTISPTPAAVADNVQLVVYDAAGAEVQRLTIPNSTEPVQWAGVTSGGAPFPPGLYRFEVESRAQGSLVLSEPAETYGKVTEAQIISGQTLLVLEGGSTVAADTVTGLRSPTSL
ncbi:flagellar hook assembly protein FlgD [Sulfitobacter mediterraneus]|uniref:flagellar hook capping FlgD N-terminal domain-containing protein n=1 Tax=Sulfitobacter mediterraneus TaxID=83219 RepID=UPI001931331F|nr:flagellar hook capping FlgD N-terminal domain-containing protein [Sulfitobacter mediterraneus]MBM1308764.1 flagellar hook assembly protein FlgD [Sulfitobacter mediterraneus]MBM1312649.1 flagellar hook assembly protein FlgD [Sulfitobacter mediterraneus]MBM1321031.1 flagellar hook assembly protein FlgD [Sulfitobacter mediterraneus]MBM1324918.1 flagellar hook assembly protein FlgD [Sulfitobacter mediterraneus]MBM1396265.1 flagellar hook assembly protein FlgD [Sulfitobacter mediterraneus]